MRRFFAVRSRYRRFLYRLHIEGVCNFQQLRAVADLIYGIHLELSVPCISGNPKVQHAVFQRGVKHVIDVDAGDGSAEIVGLHMEQLAADPGVDDGAVKIKAANFVFLDMLIPEKIGDKEIHRAIFPHGAGGFILCQQLLGQVCALGKHIIRQRGFNLLPAGCVHIIHRNGQLHLRVEPAIRHSDTDGIFRLRKRGRSCTTSIPIFFSCLPSSLMSYRRTKHFSVTRLH